MPEATYSQALNMALREEMQRDERVFCLGEDIKDSTYGVTRGLYDEFGPKRVVGTPISEAADRRRRPGLGRGGHAPGRRVHVHDLHDVRHGPAGQPGGQDEVHVRGQGGAAHRLPHHGRRRAGQRRPAHPGPGLLVLPRPGDQGGDAHHRLRRQGAAQDGHPGRQPGGLRREQGALRHGQGGRPGHRLHRPLREGRRAPRGEGRHHRRPAADGGDRPRSGRRAGRGRDRGGGDRPPHPRPPGHRDDRQLGEEDAPGGGGARGPRAGGLRGRGDRPGGDPRLRLPGRAPGAGGQPQRPHPV